MIENTLHIYGQMHPHDPVWIAGDKKALLELRDIIDRAINDELHGLSKNLEEVWVTDGEGYSVVVKKLSSEDMHQLELPYSSDIYHNEDSQEKEKKGIGLFIAC